MSWSDLSQLALADYRERTRRFSFLLTLGITLWAAYMFLPPNDSSYTTMRLGAYRGVYNSAWVGTLVAMLTTIFLGLAGFYLIKNTLTRDYHTRVGELLAASRVTSARYLLAKMLSNLGVLLSIVGVVVVMAGVTQLIRGESTRLEPLELCLPFVLITLPAMVFVAATGVLFETVRWLRGGMGNVVYYIVWVTILIVGVDKNQSSTVLLDPAGVHVAMNQMATACQEAFPDFDPERDGFSLGINIHPEGEPMHLSTYEWRGLKLSGAQLSMRLVWLAMALGVMLPALWLFDRHSFAGTWRGAKKSRRGAVVEVAEGAPLRAELEVAGGGHLSSGSFLLEAVREARSWRFAGLVASELRLALKGTSLWWYLVVLALIPACLFAPLEVARAMLFPLAWIWPILKWSPLGTREVQHGTDQLLYSSPSPVWRQLPAVWFAGVLISAATGSGMALRWWLSGDTAAIVSWLVGAMFIPSMALCCGSLTGSSKLFEILYLLLSYAGPFNGVAALDYMGATDDAVRTGMAWNYLAVAAALLAVSVVARRVRLRK